ncbi:hypothetical protein CAEBREN_06757 [Caenorhabditis brenneri]|uniref:non-specific serine/threonine protein kinase n=1 Tax=Caenorhabditis brenneri TaxID=135651 RepID=G0MH86_CAEBE|nr:hypothetical protein CAEBREN_06757 [Caenorhabditis brenneri]
MPSQVLCSGLKLKKNRYVVGHKLGAGKFGEVFKGYDKTKKMEVAVKAVAEVNLANGREEESAIGEARVLQMLTKCKGVPLLFDYFSYKNHNILVMELFKVDFNFLLKNHPEKSFSKQTLLLFGYHLVKTIRRIHECGILHRDLKPGNVFLPFHQTNTLKLAIADFGMGVKFETGGTEHPGMRIRVPSKDYGFSGSPYHSLGMAKGRAAQESDDLEMLAVMLMFCRGIRPFVGTPEEMTAKKEEMHRDPGSVVTGRNKWMRKIVELLINQPYKSTPDYEEILDEIAIHSKIPMNRDFELVQKPDGTSYLKDF